MTGEVTASYVKVGEGVSAGLALVTGVGDRNIPLSPDSLILPEPVKHLPPNVVEAARALLGQAWSIANAPAGSLPQGIAKVTKQTVVESSSRIGRCRDARGLWRAGDGLARYCLARLAG